MPDIKTALQQALAKTATDWAADDEAHLKIAPRVTPAPAPTPKEITMTATTAPATASTIETAAASSTTNLSRATFEFIRDNPGVVMADAMDAFDKKGFRPKSVASLIYQMLKVRLVVADPNGKLTAVVREYAPIQTSIRRKTKNKTKAKPVVAAGLASIAPVVTVAAPLPRKHVEIINTRTGEIINPRKEEWTVESVIGSLNVRQAMAVYDELRKIFGA